MAKRTKAQRRAAALASWARRKAAAHSEPVDAGASFNPFLAFSAEGYETLAAELQHAFSQSAHGKGKHRHANGKAFDRQPIMEIGRMVGAGYPAGQAQKKLQEAMGMLKRGETSEALAELHGAIVYTAAAAILIREQ